MVNFNFLWQKKSSLNDIETITKFVVKEITSSKNPFCLWLKGDLGAGKTTFTGFLLKHLGLPPDVTVNSPTFTYLTEYEITGKKYAHLDLYRVAQGFQSFADGTMDISLYQGLIIEWAENLKDSSEILPTHCLNIELDGDFYERSYTLFKR